METMLVKDVGTTAIVFVDTIDLYLEYAGSYQERILGVPARHSWVF